MAVERKAYLERRKLLLFSDSVSLRYAVFDGQKVPDDMQAERDDLFVPLLFAWLSQARE